MDTPTAQFDPLEHYLAAVQLDQIVLANRDKGWAAVGMSWCNGI